MIWVFYLKGNSQPKGHMMVGAWVKAIVQYLRGLSVRLALENNETEEDCSKKQNGCFTPAWQEMRCELKRRSMSLYEEHL